GSNEGIEYLTQVKDKEGLTLLAKAARDGKAKEVELLLTYGANPNIPVVIRGKKYSIADLAIQNGHSECARLLEKESHARSADVKKTSGPAPSRPSPETVSSGRK